MRRLSFLSEDSWEIVIFCIYLFHFAFIQFFITFYVIILFINNSVPTNSKKFVMGKYVIFHDCLCCTSIENDPYSRLNWIIWNRTVLYQLIGLVSRVFANSPRDQGSVPGRVIPKTQKMLLDISLLNTQHYKVRIKGKMETSGGRSSALPFRELLKRKPSGRPRLRSSTLFIYFDIETVYLC